MADEVVGKTSLASSVGRMLRDWDPAHLTGLVVDESTYDELVPAVLTVLSLQLAPRPFAERLRAMIGVRYRVRPPLEECELIAARLLQARRRVSVG